MCGLRVERWDGQKIVGPALYTSPAFAYVYNPALGPSQRQQIAFNSINTHLFAGSYITLLTVAGLTNPAANLWFWTSSQPTALMGELRTSLGNDPLSPVAFWNPNNSGVNADCSATIVAVPVPEPMGHAMALAGLGVLAAVVRRTKLPRTAP